jgi:hypothetical protein
MCAGLSDMFRSKLRTQFVPSPGRRDRCLDSQSDLKGIRDLELA